jgi:hypothetical protein
MVMSSLMTMLSFFFRDKTSMIAPLSGMCLHSQHQLEGIGVQSQPSKGVAHVTPSRLPTLGGMRPSITMLSVGFLDSTSIGSPPCAGHNQAATGTSTTVMFTSGNRV